MINLIGISTFYLSWAACFSLLLFVAPHKFSWFEKATLFTRTHTHTHKLTETHTHINETFHCWLAGVRVQLSVSSFINSCLQTAIFTDFLRHLAPCPSTNQLLAPTEHAQWGHHQQCYHLAHVLSSPPFNNVTVWSTVFMRLLCFAILKISVLSF